MLSLKQQKELLFFLNRELNRLKKVFHEITFSPDAFEIEKLSRAYYLDAIYFNSKKDFVKAFELVNYVWGLLESLALLNLIEIPSNLKKYFKIDQD